MHEFNTYASKYMKQNWQNWKENSIILLSVEEFSIFLSVLYRTLDNKSIEEMNIPSSNEAYWTFMEHIIRQQQNTNSF